MGERARQRDEYSEQEAQQRFETPVRAALNTKPKPLEDVPRKWSGAQRKRRRKKAKAAKQVVLILHVEALGIAPMTTITVKAAWDPEAGVWVAESDDVPGLATGADTLEELIERLKVAIPEMLTANGIAFEPGLLFKIDAERSESIAA